MVPVSVAPANQYADTPSGIPDPATAGPPWIQIGTEGGFMPAPVVIPQQPIGYNLDPAYFNFGIVNQHSLFLMAAERADVIVDFSAYAGKTLILYNDSPAPVPAGAAPYDNYTGDGNLMDSAARPTRSQATGPTPGRSCRSRWLPAAPHPTDLDALNAVFAKTAGQARRLRGQPGPHHHPAGGLQLRLQPDVPDGFVPVHPQYRGHAEDLPAARLRQRRQRLEPPARRHHPLRDEGDARRDGRRVRHDVRPDERHARAHEPEFGSGVHPPVPLLDARRPTSSRARSNPRRSGNWPTARRSGGSSTTAWTPIPSTRTCSPRRSSAASGRTGRSRRERSHPGRLLTPRTSAGRTPSRSTRWRSPSLR